MISVELCPNHIAYTDWDDQPIITADSPLASMPNSLEHTADNNYFLFTSSFHTLIYFQNQQLLVELCELFKSQIAYKEALEGVVQLCWLQSRGRWQEGRSEDPSFESIRKVAAIFRQDNRSSLDHHVDEYENRFVWTDSNVEYLPVCDISKSKSAESLRQITVSVL